jgi:DNA invertase Pin-like site-specific DNA recombinase
MIAIGYDRVSTSRQAVKGVSLAIQDEAIRMYCQLRGWELRGRVHTDSGISAWKGKKRPGLEKAVAIACKHKAVLVVYSLSRFSRSLIEADKILRELQAAGGHMAIVTMGADTTTPESKLLFRFMSCMAEYESDRISAHVTAAHAHIRGKKGHTTMGVQPAGFRLVNGQRIECPKEQAVLAEVRELLAAGAPAGDVARQLAERKVPTIKRLRGYKKASAWTEDGVRRLVRSLTREEVAT